MNRIHNHADSSGCSLGTRLPYPKGEGESGTVTYREATACERIPKCQLKVLQRLSMRC